MRVIQIMVQLSFQQLEIVLFNWLLLNSFICSASILWRMILWNILTLSIIGWEWCGCGLQQL